MTAHSSPSAFPAAEPAVEGPLRVLFRLGVTQTYFDASEDERSAVHPAILRAFDDLGERFGVRVLGTLDDDRLQTGAAGEWISYILADAPDLAAAVRVVDLLRETRIGSHRLWRYLRIDARVGRPLMFGNC
ncbi:hypothetical protein GCM10010359_48570 [Streptomyces morookaense]|uniref:Uncharacterized protein n=1 Tax=Streptomyces morookaense TaxID=1970 RepID=A0A7Y7E9B8_STRMO|nr:hypothetical protein [Streptomyces morookaense]NVK80251.1 hypothetical protein [Streptomyces morookaense]GHF40294.1 hypothetical protein GCM10010359_48570 [Streptomyces morookaense]